MITVMYGKEFDILLKYWKLYVRDIRIFDGAFSKDPPTEEKSISCIYPI
jgi:hypothetical protein